MLNLANHIQGACPMIHSLVKSAFETGCISVASEGLILQLLAHRSCLPTDVQALQSLSQAIEGGKVQREGLGTWSVMTHLGAIAAPSWIA